jgi:proliferating cell nuclear antigen
MDIDAEQLAIPDTAYKATVRMPTDEFQRIIRDLQAIGDTCTIAVTKEGIRFSVSGQIGTGNILIRQNNADDDEKKSVNINMEEPVELNFALRYLNFFTKASPLSDQVIICMSPDVPMVVEYPIQDFGYVKYYLAPKIEEDEDETN